MDSNSHGWRERLSELIAEVDPALEERVATADATAALSFVGHASQVSAGADHLLHDAVAAARRLGASWDAVGSELGVSRQAAQQRFTSGVSKATGTSDASRDFAPSDFAPTYVAASDVASSGSVVGKRPKKPRLGEKRVVTGATGFNELEIMERQGLAGWRLDGGGALYLEFVYVGVPTEHQRLSSNRGRATRKKAIEATWTYCFSWVFFHYFSRPISDSPASSNLTEKP